MVLLAADLGDTQVAEALDAFARALSRRPRDPVTSPTPRRRTAC